MQSAHRTRLSGQRAGVSQTPHGLPLFSFRQRVVITKACAGLVERVAPSVHGKCVHGSKASVFHGGGRRQLVADARTERPRITKPITRAVFEKFTERAIKTVMLAQLEAKAFEATEVGTEHVVLGLIMENTVAAARRGHPPQPQENGYLGLNITPEAAHAASAWVCGRKRKSGRGPRTPELAFSHTAKRAFEAAVQEAARLRMEFVGPEHLAIAVLSIGDCGALRVLARLGIDSEVVKAMALQKLRRDQEATGEGAPQPTKTPKAVVASPAQAPAKAATPKRGKGGKGDGKVLAQFCRDLCAEARAGRLDPVIGRDVEVQRVVQILGRKTKSNPVLLGEPGVGKTAVAEGIASAIVAGALPDGSPLPPFLVGQRVMALDVGLLIAGAKERGELELRVSGLLADAAAASDVIFMIDEVHTLVGGGQTARGTGAGMDIANLLKPPLARGSLRCIAATTLDDYRKYFEADGALSRRFQPVHLDAPSPAEARQMLEGLREAYERHHKCVYEPAALDAAVALSSRYIADRQLPDKAIDVLDEAGSRARIAAYLARGAVDSSGRPGGAGPWAELQDVLAAKAEAAQDGRFEEAALLRSRQVELVEALTAAVDAGPRLPRVTAADVAAVVAAWTRIPVEQLSASDSARLQRLPDTLAGRVVGQAEAVSAAARALQRAGAGLRDGRRPVAALLFCGPTGVGKTHLAKVLAEQICGSAEAITRVDMSEMMERHSVSKLLGSPPGFVGFGEGGGLTEAVRRRPTGLVLFDEVEKAHPDVLNVLLQILEDGRLTDSQGRVVSFRHSLVVMTSNVGSAAITGGSGGRVGFQLPAAGEAAEDAAYGVIRDLVTDELKAYFRPELLNRLDEVLVFRSLDRPAVCAVAGLLVAETAARLLEGERNIRLTVAPSLLDHICAAGYDQEYGARPLRRAVAGTLEDALADALLRDTLQPGDSVLCKLSAAAAAAAAAGRPPIMGPSAVAMRIRRGGNSASELQGQILSNVAAASGLLGARQRQGTNNIPVV